LTVNGPLFVCLYVYVWARTCVLTGYVYIFIYVSDDKWLASFAHFVHPLEAANIELVVT